MGKTILVSDKTWLMIMKEKIDSGFKTLEEALAHLIEGKKDGKKHKSK